MKSQKTSQELQTDTLDDSKLSQNSNTLTQILNGQLNNLGCNTQKLTKLLFFQFSNFIKIANKYIATSRCKIQGHSLSHVWTQKVSFPRVI